MGSTPGIECVSVDPRVCWEDLGTASGYPPTFTPENLLRLCLQPPWAEKQK
jgi:hypothetical protein